MDTNDQARWQFFSDGKWHRGTTAKNHRENTEEAGFSIRFMFAVQTEGVEA